MCVAAVTVFPKRHGISTRQSLVYWGEGGRAQLLEGGAIKVTTLMT